MFHINRKMLREADWLFCGLMLAIIAFSLFVLASASSNLVVGQPYYYFYRQLVWYLLALPVFAVVALCDYHYLRRFYRPLYLLALILLVAVLFAPARKGAHRWLDLGFTSIQPSELAKIIIIIVVACYLSSREEELATAKTWWLAWLIILVPTILILVEPDLGTTIICGFLGLALLFLARCNRRLQIGLGMVLVVGAILLFILLYRATLGFTEQVNPELMPKWLPLEPYQLSRLVIFINPYMDPLDSGYHMIQSQIAIGSGGLWGKGFGQGSQVQGNFLPEHHTDFIFSVVGEEFGFLGALALLILYLFFILRGWRIALQAQDLLGALLAGGVLAMLSFQFFVNAGMTLGMMPITGITLPLFSYGGSSAIFNMAALGMVFSVSLRRKDVLFQQE